MLRIFLFIFVSQVEKCSGINLEPGTGYGPLVVGGSTAHKNEFPWMVSFQIKFEMHFQNNLKNIIINCWY